MKPRTYLGKVIVNAKNDETEILDGYSTLKIPAHSSESYIIKYGFLNTSDNDYKLWAPVKDKLILGVRYIWPYVSSIGLEVTFLPLYEVDPENFREHISEIYQNVEERKAALRKKNKSD